MAYATLTDLERFGFASPALASLDDATRTAALDARSSYANGFLAKRFVLPLAAWGDDLRQSIAHMAAWDLLCRRGFDPNSSHDNAVRMRFEDADRWCHDVARGVVEPQGIVDATPDATESPSVVVTSRPRRGW